MQVCIPMEHNRGLGNDFAIQTKHIGDVYVHVSNQATMCCAVSCFVFAQCMSSTMWFLLWGKKGNTTVGRT